MVEVPAPHEKHLSPEEALTEMLQRLLQNQRANQNVQVREIKSELRFDDIQTCWI